MQSVNFEEALERILQKDGRYHREAYMFVREALDYTQKMISKEGGKDLPRHVSGQELLRGVRSFALEQFGPMTITVFREWGVQACEDFGEIVFNMVAHNLLSKTKKDTREDFKCGYDFPEAFQKPFVPKKVIRHPASGPAPDPAKV